MTNITYNATETATIALGGGREGTMTPYAIVTAASQYNGYATMRRQRRTSAVMALSTKIRNEYREEGLTMADLRTIFTWFMENTYDPKNAATLL